MMLISVQLLLVSCGYLINKIAMNKVSQLTFIAGPTTVEAGSCSAAYIVQQPKRIQRARA